LRASIHWIKRPALIAAVLSLFAWAVIQLVAIHQGASLRGEIGYDFRLYDGIARHFLQTGEMYYSHQLAGPYVGLGTVNIYPPVAMYLFMPFVLLPAILWWVVPLTVIVAALNRLRPPLWWWLAFAVAINLPIPSQFLVGLVYGNTLMWTVAGICAAAAFGPFLAWTVIAKPVDFLFALPFVWRSPRGLALGIAASLVLLPFWFDWVAAIANMTGRPGIFYAASGWPVLAVCLLARMGSWHRLRAGVSLDRLRSSIRPRARLSPG
jgi:hypothetical protein